MTAPGAPSQVRVEQALRLLPEVDALTPLRALLIASSRTPPGAVWTPGEPYRTVGRRYLEPGELRQQLPQALGRVTEHLGSLYEAVLDAIECDRRGDASGAVQALLRAGAREEAAGRWTQARIWYQHALGLAEELRDRRPEIEGLRRLGRLEAIKGRLEEAARCFQRSLALAEAELDREGTVAACHGLGKLALARGQWAGAESWYHRGLALAGDDQRAVAELTLGLGEVARSRDALDAAAEQFRRAREAFEALDDVPGLAWTLRAEASVEVRRGRPDAALPIYRDALARLQRSTGAPALEAALRHEVSQLYLDTGRLVEAEDEIRRAEELAIAHNLARPLARLYVLMGRVRAGQGDEEGFVFFEKALELSRGPEASPRLEAEVYHAYALFREGLGEREEARAYLERADEILASLGGDAELVAVRKVLARLS